MTDEKEKWLEPSFLSEVISGTALIVWAAYSELSNQDSYFSVSVGLVIYITFMISLLYRKHATDKLQLATLKARLNAESRKDFTTNVQSPSSSAYTNLAVKQQTVRNIIRMLEETIKEDELEPNKKETYEEIIKTLKTYASAYNL